MTPPPKNKSNTFPILHIPRRIMIAKRTIRPMNKIKQKKQKHNLLNDDDNPDNHYHNKPHNNNKTKTTVILSTSHRCTRVSHTHYTVMDVPRCTRSYFTNEIDKCSVINYTRPKHLWFPRAPMEIRRQDFLRLVFEDVDERG